MSQPVATELKQDTYNTGAPENGGQSDFGSYKDNGRFQPNGPEIMRLRKGRGLSRERLSNLTGMTVKTIRNIEDKTTRFCNPLTLGTLATFFGVEPHTLIEQEDQPVLRLLTSSQEIIEWNSRIVASARKVLACIGSRSRDENYLRLIETTLEAHPALLHFRTMALPPFKQQFQDHLVRVLKIRDPFCRAHGHKTIHIGIYDSVLKQAEPSICANETMALIVLPSLTGPGEYNTALLIQDAAMAEGYIGHAKSLYQMGRPVETEQAISELGLVKDGGRYV